MGMSRRSGILGGFSEKSRSEQHRRQNRCSGEKALRFWCMSDSQLCLGRARCGLAEPAGIWFGGGGVGWRGAGAPVQSEEGQMAQSTSLVFLCASPSSCRISPWAIFSGCLCALLRIDFCQSSLKEEPCSKKTHFFSFSLRSKRELLCQR